MNPEEYANNINRAKKDAVEMFAEKLKDRIYRRLWASEFVHKEIDNLVEDFANSGVDEQ